VTRRVDAALTQVLVDVTRGARRDAFAADPEAIAAAPLAPAVRAALVARDVGALWRAGAHPMALLYFARGLGWDNARYYACLDAAEAASADATRAAPSAGSAPAPPAPSRTRPPSAPHAR
jgi:hypothetical protein